MKPDELRQLLNSPEQVQSLLDAWGVSDRERGNNNLVALATLLGDERLLGLWLPLNRLLPRLADADMALNNLERFFASAGPAFVPELSEDGARMLETLLQIFSTSQYFSDLLINNPDYLEMLRVPLRSSPSRDEMLVQMREDVT